MQTRPSLRWNVGTIKDANVIEASTCEYSLHDKCIRTDYTVLLPSSKSPEPSLVKNTCRAFEINQSDFLSDSCAR
jgi:hypothetical protein